MAISKQLKDEADRTIAGITDYYDKYGDALLDAEEREHRIGKVTTALEGCNGLTEKEKLQKTAENLFGLTCTWERDSLALKRELMLNREITEKAFRKSKEETDAAFAKLGGEVSSMGEKLDKLASDLKYHHPAGRTVTNWHYRILTLIDTHFGAFSFSLIALLLIIVLSGHFDWLVSLFSK